MSQKTYREGEIVWAKMRGHPAWPAKVARPPKGASRPPGKLWIFFYGTHEHAWMMTADLFSYEDNKDKFRLPKKIKGFAEAIWEVEEDPDLVITLGKPPSKRRKRSTSKHGNKEEDSEVTTATSTVLSSVSQGVQSAEDLSLPTLTATPHPTSTDTHSPILTATPHPTSSDTPPTLTATPPTLTATTLTAAPPTLTAPTLTATPPTLTAPTLTATPPTLTAPTLTATPPTLTAPTLTATPPTLTAATLTATPPTLTAPTLTATPRLTSTASFLPSVDCTSSDSRDRPRYITRRRKCKSEGIVAQITQSFAARMELKSPRNRDANSSLSGCDPTGEVGGGVVTDKESTKQTDDTEEPVKVEQSAVISESAEQSAPAVVILEERKKRQLKKGEEGPKRAPQRVLRRATRSSGRLARKAADKGNRPESETQAKGEDQVAGLQESYREVCAGPAVDVLGSEEVDCSSEKMSEEVTMAQLCTSTSERLEEDPTVEHIDGETITETEIHVVGELEGQALGVGTSEELIASRSSAAEIDKEKPISNNNTSQTGVDTAANIATDPMAVSPGETAPPSEPLASCDEGRIVRGETENEEASTGSPELQLLRVEKSMSAVDALMILNYNLKASLTTHAPDVHGAKAVLRELLSLEYTSRDLHRVPDLVASVRKVRRYHGNEIVRSTAEDVYSAMKSVFMTPGQPPPPPPPSRGRASLAARGKRPMKISKTRGATAGHAPSRERLARANKSGSVSRRQGAKDDDVQVPEVPPVGGDSGDQPTSGVIVGMTSSASEDQTVPASDL